MLGNRLFKVYGQVSITATLLQWVPESSPLTQEQEGEIK
jgi:hypothetical protein